VSEAQRRALRLLARGGYIESHFPYRLYVSDGFRSEYRGRVARATLDVLRSEGWIAEAKVMAEYLPLGQFTAYRITLAGMAVAR